MNKTPEEKEPESLIVIRVKEENVNLGASYADYLKADEEKRRKKPKKKTP